MRLFLAGLISLLLVSAALASVKGKVESIGLGSFIRPDCWIPMVVQIESDSASAEEYVLQVVQFDRDGDEVVYSRPITVNPGVWPAWTYFKPQSVNGGFPVSGRGEQIDLAKTLRIFLANPKDGRRIAQLNTARKLPQALEYGAYETIELGNRHMTAGQKLALVVGRSPNFREFDPSTARVQGMMEIFQPVGIEARQLPDNVIGYEMVDVVIWTDADPVDGLQLRALKQYVEGGGRLVVLQNAEKDRMKKLDDLLPVSVARIEEWNSLDPLQSILVPPTSSPPVDDKTNRKIDSFANVKGPFRMARAKALPDAVVVKNVIWPDKSASPYIARHMVGMGTVAWIAQDLSDPAIKAADFGWPRIWEEIFGWRDFGLSFTTTATNGQQRDNMIKRYDAVGTRELGLTYMSGMDPQSKTTALLTVAFIFFIGYWLVAGPGSYLVLAARKRTHWSWFVFACVAGLAVLLTVGVTKIMLSGSADVRHISMVRARCDTNDSARVMSRFGVYLPEDRTANPAPITINKRDVNNSAWITPLTSRFLRGDVNARDTHYDVPIRNEDVDDSVSIAVPFRSTLKKLQAEWSGAIDGRISGKPTLVTDDKRLVVGKLSNNTGRDLQFVTMVFRWPLGTERSQDQVIYMRTWPKGQTIELNDLWKKGTPGQGDATSLALTGDYKRGSWILAQKWIFDDLRLSGMMNTAFDDSDKDYRRSFLVVSLFDAMTPMQNNLPDQDRTDIVRRGMRNWEVSGPLGAGAMVILAQTVNDKIPMPLEVDGRAPDANGRTFWQFIVPMDHSQINAPTTQASE